MDWKALRAKAVDLTHKTKAFTAEAFKTSKEYALLASIKSYESLKASSFAIRNEGDFEKCLAKNKKVIIVLLDNESAKELNFIIKYPVYLTRSWIDSAVLMICDRQASESILHHFWSWRAPSIHCYIDKQPIARFETPESYQAFTRTFEFPSNKNSIS